MESSYLDRPLNFAHRGASHEAPENTLAAFLLAAELGADGVEFDAQLSKDRQVVVIHDFALESTTDGHGLVRDRTLAELRALDAGGWFDPEFAGQRIPTLHEVIESVGHLLLLNIELKTSKLRDDGLAAAIVGIIKEHNLLGRVVVSSFSPLAVRRVKALNPRIPIGLLYAPDMSFFLRRPWFRHLLQPQALHPHCSTVDERYVSWAKGRGYRIHAWTVDDPGEMWKLTQLGVDLIITNRPDLLQRVLHSGPRGDSPRARRQPSAARLQGI